MPFDPSCFTETAFFGFWATNVLALNADIKFLHLRTAHSFFAVTAVRGVRFRRSRRYRTWKRERKTLVLQMSKSDPNFGGAKDSGFDPATLFRRLDGDVELLRDLLQIFSEESPLLLKKISTAIEHGSFEDVRKLSHKLKGSALQFSGDRAASLAASLEQMGADQSLEGAARIFSELKREVANLEQSLQSIVEGRDWTS